MTKSARSDAKAAAARETREALLDAAFDQMYLHGFRGAGLNDILDAAGLTKGALYHHFAGKMELGYAVVEERVVPLVRERYLDPFREVSDPVDAVARMGMRMRDELLKEGILARGCPLNNLVQEMSGVDAGFRERLAAVVDEWRATVASSIEQGRSSGSIATHAHPDSAATLVVASLLGAVGFAKNALDLAPFDACRKEVNAYMATLRPAANASV